MEDLSLNYFLNCGRDFLYITDEKQPAGFTPGSKLAIVFLFLNCFRYGITLLPSNIKTTSLLFVNHFEIWGDVLLWTLLTLNVSTVTLCILLISSFFKRTQPDILITMANPLRQFLKKEMYKTFYYKVMIKFQLISVIMFCLLPITCDTYAVISKAKYSADLIPLVVSSIYMCALTGLSSYSGCVLSTVAILVDILCRTLRSDFKNIELRLLNTHKKCFLFTFRMFHESCRDVAIYDSHWKRILFTIVTGLTVFMAFAIYLFAFTQLPKLFGIFGLVVISLIYVFLSFCLLAPASVCSSSRRLHSRFCRLVFRTRSSPIHTRMKLIYTIKRFQRPISFSLWDTNHIDYMDYFNVSFCYHDYSMTYVTFLYS